MKVSVPLVTRLLIISSDFTQKWWPLLLLLPVVSFVGVKLARRNKKAELELDRVTLKIPIFGIIIYNRILALFSEQLRILTKAGLTVDRSFDLAAEVIDNRVYHDAVVAVKGDVLSGASISEAMARQKVFPAMLVRMVYIGENSGTLEEQFGFLANYYLKKLDEITKRLGKMIEPIIIMFLGILFALIIIGLLLPIYDLISAVGRM
jgi:type II secretory pathway component PulF